MKKRMRKPTQKALIRQSKPIRHHTAAFQAIKKYRNGHMTQASTEECYMNDEVWHQR